MVEDDYKKIHALLEKELHEVEQEGQKARLALDFELANVYDSICEHLDKALAGVGEAWDGADAIDEIKDRRESGAKSGWWL